MSIKKDDQVVVITGKDKGQRGKVIAVMPKDGKVVVEGINMVSRHYRPRKQGEEGGIIKKEAPMYACKVMTARRSASARSAVLKSKRGGVEYYA